MRTTVNLLLAAVLVLGTSAVSMAGSRGINAREYREQQRINQGIRSGELTRLEARRLEAGLARIRIDERFARSDGHLSLRERARLDRELNREGQPHLSSEARPSGSQSVESITNLNNGEARVFHPALHHFSCLP